LVALALCFGAAEAFFIPAYQALPAQLVLTEDLLSANALMGFSRYASNLVGPALGATLIAATSTTGAFAFDGITFVASALCLVLLRMPHPSTQQYGNERGQPGGMGQGQAQGIAPTDTMAGRSAEFEIGPPVQRKGIGGVLDEAREGWDISCACRGCGL